MLCDMDLTLFRVAEQPYLPRLRDVAQDNFLERYSQLMGSLISDKELRNITKRVFTITSPIEDIALKISDIAKANMDKVTARPELLKLLKDEFGSA